MTDTPLDEIDQLLSDLLDGDWDEFKQHRLNEMLRESEEARSRYRITIQMHALLETGSSGTTARTPLPTISIPELKDEAVPSTSPGLVPYLGWAVAATIALAILIWSFATDEPAPVVNSDPMPVDTAREFDAIINRLIDVEWDSEEQLYEVGDSLTNQWLDIEAGMVRLDFQGGARMVVEGPARLRVESEALCFVERGKLTVLAEGEAADFVVRTPHSEIIDLGTEFGIEVSPNGVLEVHVLKGKVEVALKEQQGKGSVRKLLQASEAVHVDLANGIQSAAFSADRYEAIRVGTLLKHQPIRLQFDCGNGAGVYQGVESPAHAAGDFYDHETFWNTVIGDQIGQVAATDGSLLPYELKVDLGQYVSDRQEFDWNEPPTIRGSVTKSRGVFHTSLGEDGIRGGSQVGVRIQGLPKGKYRIYVVGRSSLVHPKWGNFLTIKSYKCWIGIGETGDSHLIAPLDDEHARQWVEGQTHAVGEITIGKPSDYLQLIVEKDLERSPKPKGGGAMILGVQIMQVSQ